LLLPMKKKKKRKKKRIDWVTVTIEV